MLLLRGQNLQVDEEVVQDQWSLYMKFAEDPAFLEDHILMELVWLSGVDPLDTWTILKNFRACGIVRLNDDALELDM